MRGEHSASKGVYTEERQGEEEAEGGGAGWEGGEASCGITVIKPSYSGR